MSTGIRKLHSKACPGRDGGRCRCGAGWEASVYSKRDKKKIRKVFAREGEAKSWRSDALSALNKGVLRAPKPITLRQAWEAWQEGAGAGTVTNRSGDPYKPSALRSYERAMRRRVLPEIGGARLADIRRPDLQALVDRLGNTGLNPSTVRCTMLPVRAVFRRAVSRGELAVNPCDGLELAAARGRRDRIASPDEAEALSRHTRSGLGDLGDRATPVFARVNYRRFATRMSTWPLASGFRSRLPCATSSPSTGCARGARAPS
jgi:integrase